METKNIFAMIDEIKSAWDKDHPQTVIAKFTEVSGQFIKDSDYKGLLVFFKHCLPMSDMLEESIISIIDQEERNIYDAGQEPLRALFLMMKGLTIKKNRYWCPELKEILGQALTHAVELDVPISDFEWFVSKDEYKYIYDINNQPIYGHSLLTYIAAQTKRFDLLAQYYQSVGNSDATCLAQYMDIHQRWDKDELIKLLEKYQETPVSLFAFEDLVDRYIINSIHYKPIEERNILVSKTVNKLKSLQARFPNWPDIGIATKLLEKLSEPEVNVRMNKNVLLPYKPNFVTLEMKNTGNVRLAVYRSNIKNRKGLHDINSKVIEKSFDETPVFQKVCDFDILEKHLWQSACIEIDSLDPGLYKLVLRVDDRICCAEKLQVSQLCLLAEPLPKNNKRIAVLDAATGLPIPNAFVHLEIDGKTLKREILQCNEKGEVIWDSKDDDASLYPYTENDQWADTVNLNDWNTYEYSKMKSHNTGDILTDRSIYRPGQTIHITLVRYCVSESNQVKTVQHENIGISIEKRFSDDKIWKQKIRTDDYGVAQIDFHIPDDLEPGDYSIQAGNGLYKSIEIEEYKRPTFKVELDPYTQPYKIGDTIIIKGKATSYTGVPIANAKVNYETYTEMSLWFYRFSFYWDMGRYTYSRLTEQEIVGETTTDTEGNFKISVSLQFDEDKMQALKDRPLFLDFTANIDVVDATGETQGNTITLPLANRELIIASEMDYKMDISEGLAFTPVVRNLVGEKLECKIRYQIDDEGWRIATSGKKEIHHGIAIGKHMLRLEYGSENFEREFIMFDKGNDKAPCEIDNWEYYSSDEFPEDGSPVILQVGSSTPETYILYDVFSGNSIVESGAIKSETGVIRWELPYEKKYGNGILINFVWVHNQEVQHNSVTIKRPIPKLELKHEWVLWQEKYNPGGHVKWMAKISAPDGTIMPTNTIAVVYDKALDQLAPHYWRGFGPRLEWNVPESEWRYREPDSLNHHWIANESPYNDADSDCGCVRCCPSPAHSHKGMCNCMDFGGGSLSDGITMRSNFAETAYFASNIHANKNGEIEIEFDLPDTLTTWKLMMISCTQDLHWCYVEEEFVSNKNLMVTANMPRFLRTGDSSTISAKVTNQSDKTVCAQIVMEILHAISRDVVFSESKTVNIDSGSTVATSFNFVPEEDVENYICRIFANGGTCSDGEERTIPVLSNKAKVTVTHVFDQCGQNQYQVKPQELFPNDTSCHQLSLDYTNNALWLAIKAMKGMVKYDKENAVSVMVALYSAILTKHLNEQVIGGPKSIKSDEEIERLIKTLGKLQLSDGGFCWYKGMTSSIYITAELLMHLSRLSAMVPLPPKLLMMMEDGFSFADKDMKKTVKKLRKQEKEGLVQEMPFFTLLQHLYSYAISGRTISKGIRDDYNYLVKLMLRDVHKQTIYEKAMSAVILDYAGEHELALEYVESLRQYTEEYGNRGRSFKTCRASYSWYSYKIPTHVAAMEAICRVCPNEKDIITEMQKWLLNEKRTQVWETPIDSVNAVYALLQSNIDALHENIATSILVDNNRLECDCDGKEGHVQTDLNPEAQLITFEKESNGMAWGAVYANFLQPLSDVESSGSGMSIEREIISDKEELHVGDRITVRLTYKCDRNYDMVEIIDSKAACMEPVNQLSWCDSFKHVAPHDTKIVYSYYGLAEGTHSIETEFWLDRPGTYEIGLATIHCAYASEFRATCPSQKLIVLP